MKVARVNDRTLGTLTSPFGLGGTVPQPALDDLSDVDTTGVVDGDTLVWDSGTGTWISAAGASPTGSAGGDLSGTYPNPSVVDDSHSHTAATAPGSGIGPLLITDTPAGSPLVFADLLQNEAGTDLLYADA